MHLTQQNRWRLRMIMLAKQLQRRIGHELSTQKKKEGLKGSKIIPSYEMFQTLLDAS